MSTPEQIAEEIVREHDERCIGEWSAESPWCATAPDGTPLCVSCQHLRDKIAAALRRQSHEAERLIADICANIQKWHDAYPVEVFGELPPPPAKGERETASRDCIAGAMGRHMAKCLVAETQRIVEEAALSAPGSTPTPEGK